MTKEKTRTNQEALKLYNSPLYRHRIKKTVESIKTLCGIPWGSKLPGKPNQLGKNATEKEKEKHAKMVAYRIDRDTAHYWAQTIEASFDRRVISSTRNEEE